MEMMEDRTSVGVMWQLPGTRGADSPGHVRHSLRLHTTQEDRTSGDCVKAQVQAGPHPRVPGHLEARRARQVPAHGVHAGHADVGRAGRQEAAEARAGALAVRGSRGGRRAQAAVRGAQLAKAPPPLGRGAYTGGEREAVGARRSRPQGAYRVLGMVLTDELRSELQHLATCHQYRRTHPAPASRRAQRRTLASRLA